MIVNRKARGQSVKDETFDGESERGSARGTASG
jgi:hypothetical protein